MAQSNKRTPDPEGRELARKPSPSATTKTLEEILEAFALRFAMHEEDGTWWGHDTNLGNQKTAFNRALAAINNYIEAEKEKWRNEIH